MKFGSTPRILRVTDDRRQALAIARDIGCDGVEVSLPVGSLRTGEGSVDEVLAEVRDVRADFDAVGLEVISLTPGIMLKHAEHPEVIDAVCRAAEVLGTRMVRLMSAPCVRWGGPDSKLDDWMSEFDGTRHAGDWLRSDAERLKLLLELSAEHDVRYVFELHPGYVVTSASAAMRMLDSYPADRVGIIMDPGNMVVQGNEGWRNSVQIMGQYMAYLHCKNVAFRRADGQWTYDNVDLADGLADFGEIMTALKDEGFDGYLCSEDMRVDEDYAQRVRRELAYLRGLVESNERVAPQ